MIEEEQKTLALGRLSAFDSPKTEKTDAITVNVPPRVRVAAALHLTNSTADKKAIQCGADFLDPQHIGIARKDGEQ